MLKANRIIFGAANQRPITSATSQTPVTRIMVLNLIACLFGLTMPLQVPGEQPEKRYSFSPQAALYYQLVERVKKGDLTVDFLQLRRAYADWSSDSKSATKAPNRDAMVQAFETKDYAKAVVLVEEVLDYEFLHTGLHRAAEDAYRQLGNESKARFHHDITEKLIKALLSTGDGKSPESAYQVFSVNEEYLIMHELRYVKEENFVSQSLIAVGDKPYDVLTGTDPNTGKRVRVYFDISFFFGGRRRAN